jgi:sugar-specific transcriptional regulator TrmB
MQDILEIIGLNQREAQIYRALLSLNCSTVNKIAAQSQIYRPTAYEILEKLEKRGVVTTSIQDGRLHYEAIPPEKFLVVLKEKELAFKRELPALLALKKNTLEKPRVETFTGKEGMKILFERILDEAASFYCMASNKQLSQLFKYYLPTFVRRRIKKGISVKIITDSHPVDKNAPYKKIEGNIKTATWIYDKTVIMASLDQKIPIALLIKEKNIYETQKLLFETLWNFLPDKQIV